MVYVFWEEIKVTSQKYALKNRYAKEVSGKVVNSAQFNTINKGTGVTSATKGGYYIRQYNFNNKEFLYMKSTYGNFSNTFSIVSEVNENEK